MKEDVISDSSKSLKTYGEKYVMPKSISGYMMQRPPGSPIGMPQQPPIVQPQPRAPQNGTPIRLTPISSPYYLQGYLRQHIGQYIRVDFLIGTSSFIDRDGILTDVGIDFIEMQEVQTGNIIVCDFYSIKFVTVYPAAPGEPYIAPQY